MASLRELSKKPEILTAGHRLCAGCGAPIAIRQVLLASDKPVIVGFATGCVEVATTIYPYTAWKCPWIHNAFENVCATISGVETAYRALKKKGKISDDINFIAFGGDGGMYDIGLQSLSGALERGHRMLSVCTPPDTELIMDDGSIIQIGKFVDAALQMSRTKVLANFEKGQYIVNHTTQVEDGFESGEANGSLFSWDYKSSFVFSNITRVQKIESPPVLIYLRTASGSILRLTPEHEIFIDSAEGPIKIPARYVRKGDEVYAPRKINIEKEKDPPYIIDFIKENVCASLPEHIRMLINEMMKKYFGSIREACNQLGLNYWQFKERGRNIKLETIRKIANEIPEFDWEGIKRILKTFVVPGGGKITISNEYLKLNEKIMYLFGLISSDGFISQTDYVVAFANGEQALIDIFKKICKEMFTGRKISEFKDRSGITRLVTSNVILRDCCTALGIKTDPIKLFSLPENLIAAYLRGFFDGDGYAGIISYKRSQSASVILSTVDQLLAKRLRFLLKRLGIVGFQDKRKGRYDITLSSRQDIITFFNRVNSLHPKKQSSLKKIMSHYETVKERGKYFSLAPRVCGKILKEIWLKYNISPTKLDKKRNVCTISVDKRRVTKNKMKIYINKIKLYVNQNEPLFQYLERLTNNDFFLDPIVEIETIPSVYPYVYDVTIKDTHSFVPEAAFAISNCYDNEAYMNCLSLSSLIMTKEGIKKIIDVKVGDDVYAFNQKTRQLMLKKCSGVFDNGIKDVYKLSTLHHAIKTTSNHPFLILKRNERENNGRIVCKTKTTSCIWKTLEQVRLGDEVVTLKNLNEDFETEEIISIKYIGKEPTLDLRVEDEHNFIANGIVVHNTGIQRSSATPKGAATTTTPAGKVIQGKQQYKKDLTAVVAAHKIPYVATASPSHWNDLITKAQKAFSVDGPSFMNILTPCPRGWRFKESDTIKIAKLAVDTCFWPLYEVENGATWRITYIPKQIRPLSDWTQLQGRFAHLHTPQNKHILDELQEQVKRDWEEILKKSEKKA